MIEHPGVAARFGNPCEICGTTDEHARQLSSVRTAIGQGRPVATLCPHPEQPRHGTGCTCDGRSAASAAGFGSAPQRVTVTYESGESEGYWPKAVADALAAALLRDAGALRHAIEPLADHELRRIHDAAMMLARETGKRRWDRRAGP